MLDRICSMCAVSIEQNEQYMYMYVCVCSLTMRPP